MTHLMVSAGKGGHRWATREWKLMGSLHCKYCQGLYLSHRKAAASAFATMEGLQAGRLPNQGLTGTDELEIKVKGALSRLVFHTAHGKEAEEESSELTNIGQSLSGQGWTSCWLPLGFTWQTLSTPLCSA
jgi:hypothetical protein